jgi:HlyD family secretion protein
MPAPGDLHMADEESPKSTRPLRRFLPIVIVLLGLLGYGGYRLYSARKPYEWSGTVEARVVSVGSRVGGRIKEVKVREGDAVTAGQPLVVLEPGDLPAQRLMAAGQLAQAQAMLDKLVKGARPEEIEQAQAHAQTATSAYQETRAGARREQVAAARARLDATQVAVDKGQTDAERVRRLFATQAVSQAEVDNVEAALKGALAQRDAAKEQLAELENGARQEDLAQALSRAREAQASAKLVVSGSRVEDIQAQKGVVDAAQGRLDQMDVALAELTIKAPSAGRIESLDLRPGDIIAPNATALTLLEDGQLYVRIYVPETHVGAIHVGEDVPISVDSFPGRAFKGKVEHINAVGEYSPRNLQTADERADQVFATRIGLEDGKDDLRAGMAAFIQVPK